MDRSDASPSYLWQYPAKPIAVNLSLDVVDRLGAAVKEGFKSLPRRGLETGGLLLGSEKRANGITVVSIEDFEALESEHAFGPSYLLSTADRKLLEERIAWHKSKHAHITGFYRSHTRREFALTVEDIDLMDAWFSRESNVFLLLQSNGDLAPTAGFAIWEAKKIRSHVPYGKFEFSRAALAAEATVSQPPAATAPKPVPRVVSLPKPAPPKPAPLKPELPATSSAKPAIAELPLSDPEPRKAENPLWSHLRLPQLPAHDWGWVAAVGIVAVALLMGAMVRYNGGHRAAPVRLGLDLRHDGNALRLLWNRDASVVRKATRAVVWIADGQRESKLDLDPAQLAGGSIVYWPRTSDVNFRMEVFSPAALGSESVRSIGAPASGPEPAADAPVPEPLARVSNPASPSRAPERVGDRSRVDPNPRPEASGTEMDARAEVSPAGLPTAPPPPIPESAPQPASPTLPFKEPPPPETRSLSPEHSSIPADTRWIVKAETLPEGSAKSGFFGRLLGGKHSDRPGFVPPRPTQEPPLTIPANLRARAHLERPIDVRVYVDPTGKVEYAELETEASQTDADLAALAVFSSRRWQFAPAQVGGRKVAGEVVLRYRFGSQ